MAKAIVNVPADYKFEKYSVEYDCETCGETTATVDEVETYSEYRDGVKVSQSYNEVMFCDTCGIADW